MPTRYGGNVGDTGKFERRMFPALHQLQFVGVGVEFDKFHELVQCPNGVCCSSLGPGGRKFGQVLSTHWLSAGLLQIAGSNLIRRETAGSGGRVDPRERDHHSGGGTGTRPPRRRGRGVAGAVHDGRGERPPVATTRRSRDAGCADQAAAIPLTPR